MPNKTVFWNAFIVKNTVIEKIRVKCVFTRYFDKLLHEMKAHIPIEETNFGIVICFKEENNWNLYTRIVSTPSPMLTISCYKIHKMHNFQLMQQSPQCLQKLMYPNFEKPDLGFQWLRHQSQHASSHLCILLWIHLLQILWAFQLQGQKFGMRARETQQKQFLLFSFVSKPKKKEIIEENSLLSENKKITKIKIANTDIKDLDMMVSLFISLCFRKHFQNSCVWWWYVATACAQRGLEAMDVIVVKELTLIIEGVDADGVRSK